MNGFKDIFEASEFIGWEVKNSPKAYALNREIISQLVGELEAAEINYQRERKENVN